MNKTVVTILVVIVLAAVGFFLFSTPQSPTPSISEPTPSGPVKGTVITITNCQGTPGILQVQEGGEITFLNDDEQAHQVILDNQTIDLPANGSAKVVAKFSLGKNATYNYTCDGETVDAGGAIYVQP